jgi:hypothetical protein
MSATKQRVLNELVGKTIVSYKNYKTYTWRDPIDSRCIKTIPANTVFETKDDRTYIIYYKKGISFTKNGNPVKNITEIVKRMNPLTVEELEVLHDQNNDILTINVDNGNTVIYEKKDVMFPFVVKSVKYFDDRTYTGFWGRLGYVDDPKQLDGYIIMDTDDNKYRLCGVHL